MTLSVLTTPRLVLRRPDNRDIDSIVAIAGDWEVARRLVRMPYPYTRDHARFFLDAIVPTERVWGVTLRASGDLVGMIGLTPKADAPHELGYYVARAHWGEGIATEAARAVVDHAFGPLALPALGSGFFADNPASGRVLRKLGFVETGRAERPCLAAGTTVASTEMRLSAADWRGCR